jgi:hypothetical protein
VGVRYFIDESKAKGYLVVAVACPEESQRSVRRELGRLVLPRQRSVHMKLEGNRRRRLIADAVVGLSSRGVRATAVSVVGGGREHLLRERALREVVRVVGQAGGGSLVLDLDPTQVRRDRQVFIEAFREWEGVDLTYRHSTLASEPLLTLPDVIAWCLARGGDWRRRIAPAVSEMRRA